MQPTCLTRRVQQLPSRGHRLSEATASFVAIGKWLMLASAARVNPLNGPAECALMCQPHRATGSCRTCGSSRCAAMGSALVPTAQGIARHTVAVSGLSAVPLATPTRQRKACKVPANIQCLNCAGHQDRLQELPELIRAARGEGNITDQTPFGAQL